MAVEWLQKMCSFSTDFLLLCTAKLVLVRQKKTWKEAADYCERHHMGLVLAYSEEIQGWTREVAMGASTAHVWLGMFFVCPLNLWFWTNRVTVCLSDWAMGNGTRMDECGQAGALQSGGQQKWVSQPETERLNFICSAF